VGGGGEGIEWLRPLDSIGANYEGTWVSGGKDGKVVEHRTGTCSHSDLPVLQEKITQNVGPPKSFGIAAWGKNKQVSTNYFEVVHTIRNREGLDTAYNFWGFSEGD